MIAVSPTEILSRARDAQRRWKASSIHERVRTMAALRRAIATEQGLIARTVAADTGKPELDALSGDVLVTLEQMLFYERRATRFLKPQKLKKSWVLFSGCSFYEELEPHGVALIYAPSNYPFQLALVPAITALYAGNAVVLKASERAPLVARLIERLSAENLPADLLQVLDQDPAFAATLIEAGPDLVFFTGSSANGREVASLAAARLIPTVLELGGKDAALVFADCKLERTVEGVVYGAFAHAGQVCVGIKRLYVEQPLYERFVVLVCERVEQLRVGSDSNCDFARLRDQKLGETLRSQVADAQARGAQLRTGGGQCDRPTVLTEVDAQARLLLEESFGPVLCVAPFATEAEAIARANDSPFALGASVWTTDLKRGRRIASALHAGNCAVNDVIRNIANPHAAFGGNGASGYGRYHGPHGLLSFSRTKTVMTLRSRRRRELHWFPFVESTRVGLSRLIELRHRPRGWLHALCRIVSVLSVLAFAVGSHAQTLSEGHLWLDIRLPNRDHGRVAGTVFNSTDGFPNDKSKLIRHGFSPDSDGQSRIEIDVGSFPGEKYAAAYLDEDGNGRLDCRFLGVSKEQVGAPNNPPERYGSLRFNACAFVFGQEGQTVVIQLVASK
jgi:acyl-CoA reductase-like NAD-dependent aldehyde dehydrogenase/uncharacterized protein (DUF2141 family)